jgi:protein tyrosine phosphatase (PTP) superfamily phosphohydrolase (DUF442 family)
MQGVFKISRGFLKAVGEVLIAVFVLSMRLTTRFPVYDKIKHTGYVLTAYLIAVSAAAILIIKIVLASPPIIDNAKQQQYQSQRPVEWAVKIEKDGLPNFHKVSDDLYRGAQPAAIGISQLKDMGIKTIINLRAFNSDKDEIGDVEIGYVNINFKTWHPEDEDVAKFLSIVMDKTKLPAFVHCQHGADRTGMMCAVYRVAVCGWSKDAAVEEMIYGGYGFHPVWRNIIDYFTNLDIEKLKSEALKLQR